jgi:hypothetical protein
MKRIEVNKHHGMIPQPICVIDLQELIKIEPCTKKKKEQEPEILFITARFC